MRFDFPQFKLYITYCFEYTDENNKLSPYPELVVVEPT